MSRFIVRVCSLLGVLFLLLIRSSGGDSASLPPLRATGTRPPIGRSLASLPLAFVENRGQLDSRVAYYVPGHEASVYFGRDGVTFVLKSGGVGATDREMVRASLRSESAEGPARRHVVRLEFPGANPEARLRAGDRAAGQFSYFRGPQETWQTEIPTYSGVVYEELWPGIDLVYGGTASRLKYEFVVRPGADPSRIRLAYCGADSVRRTEDGDLEVETSAGRFRDQKPVAYQAVAGGRSAVDSAFRPVKSRSAGTFPFVFDVGAYDRSEPLVIDPAVIISSGLVGGSGNEVGITRVALNGDIYIASSTNSTEASFPAAVGPDLTYNGGAFDGFVARIKADGSGLVYAGYIGGSGNDTIDDIALDFSGNAYVVGRTDSTQTSFPVLGGPDLTYNGGVFDAFVAKVNAAGTALVYCGYIGGSADDRGTGIAVDFGGNAYVTGFTSSNNLPVAVGPDLTFNGGFDAFVAKVDNTGSSLVYCGYIGGSNSEQAHGIAWHFSGTVTIVGETSSTETTTPNAFPVAVGPDLTYNGGVSDAFIAEVNATGSALNYCGYIGGTALDNANAVFVDGNQNAYVTGQTSSTQASFPVLVGPDLTFNGGTFDAFVAKVNVGGATLAYCGYIGGGSDDIGDDIAVDDVGGAVVVGATSSTETTFPVLIGPDLTYNGGPTDAFVAKVAPGGRRLDHCGYIGGSGTDSAFGVALDFNGEIVISGLTDSSETTFPVLVGPDLTANGGSDAFVTRMTGCNGLLVNSTADTVDVKPGDGACADASGNCTLRAAIQEANALGFAVSTICVPPGTYALTIADAAGDENAAATGDLDITTGYDINGDGPPGSVIIDAGGTAGSPRRAFDIQPGVNDPGVGMFNLTIQGGYAAARGGGIRVQNGSALQLVLVTLRNNQASLSGGGLAVEGSAGATIVSGTIANNQVLTAGEFGGGLWIDVNSSASVDSSTVSGNQAPAPTRRGGIAALGSLSMNNSTVSGNRAAGQFGVGLYAPGSSYDIHSSTFADNSTSTGGFELEASGTPVFIENSVLGGDASRNCSSALATNGGNVETGNTCGFGAGDLINTNPLLGLLADNGGFTQTHGLLSGSPAIDAGNGSCPPPATDQRGVTRPIGARCDSGSFEGTVVITSADLQVTKTGPATVTTGSNVVYTVAVTNNGPGSASAVSVSDATPAGLTFVSNAGACTTVFPCSLGTVNNGQTLTITSTFFVPPSYAGPNPISNTASVSSTTADPTPGNNSSTATTGVTGSGPPTLSIGSVAVVKPESGTVGAVFPVTLSFASTSTVQVFFSTSDDTAKAGVDYQSAASTLSIPPGATSAAITVLVNGNTIASDDKTFIVTIFGPTNAVIGTGVAYGIIQDQTPLPSLSIADLAVSGGTADTQAVFAVTLSAASGRTVSVNYQTSDGTATAADHDYLPTSGTLFFAPGQTAKTVSVTVLGKPGLGPTETFYVDLSPAVNASVARSRGVGTITRGYPALSAQDAAVLAPGSGGSPGTAVLSVNLSPSSTQTVSVSYATADGTAVAGVDYTAVSGTLTFAPGETTKPVPVPILPRSAPGPTKLFTLTLTSPSNALVSKGLGDCAIFDPSTPLPPGPFLFIGDVTVSRPGSSFATNARVSVRLTEPSAVPISVSYATGDGTAHAGTDYLPTSGTLGFAPGQTARTILVPILHVPPGGGNKAFQVSLADPVVGAFIAKAEGTVAIVGP